MSFIDVKQIVDENVFVNGQNLVTAQMVNTAITAVINQSSTYIGDADSLPIGQNLSEAIAILNARIPDTEFPLKVLLGTTDPNTNPPAGANNGDFYIRNSSKVYQLSSGIWYSFEDIDFDLRTSIIDSVLKQNLDNGDTFIRLDANDGLSLKKITWSNIVDALGNIFIRIGSNLGALISSDVGNNITTGSDGGLYSSGGVTQIDWGDIYGNISNQLDLVALIGNYLPLTGGTLTGPLSATNFETEKGIEFLSNIEISKLLASGELAVRITDTGVPIYVFNETGTPSNPKDVITKEFFDANAGGAAIEVTVDTNRATPAKIGVTSGGNYSPSYGDILDITFINGFSGNGMTSLRIDESDAYPARLGLNNLNQNQLQAATDSSNYLIKMWFDGDSYQLFGSQVSYPNTDLATLLGGTNTAFRVPSAKLLTDWIDQKYVPMFGFKTQTIVLSPLDEDLTVGLCEYVYTVQDDILLVSYPTNVQSPSSGVAVETVIRRNGTNINVLVRSVIPAGQLDTFSGGSDGVFNPPVQLTKGDKLSFYVYASGSTVLAKGLTVTLNFQ